MMPAQLEYVIRHLVLRVAAEDVANSCGLHPIHPPATHWWKQYVQEPLAQSEDVEYLDAPFLLRDLKRVYDDTASWVLAPLLSSAPAEDADPADVLRYWGDMLDRLVEMAAFYEWAARNCGYDLQEELEALHRLL